MSRRLTVEDLIETTGCRDRSNLSSISEVEILFLSFDEISSLDTCTQLRKLTLIDNGLKRISNLRPLGRTLTVLCICDQEITRMENLALPFLQELYLHRNCISVISGLHECPRLKKLWLFQNKINAITDLHTLAELEELWLQSNSITSLDGLAMCASLRRLSIAGNPIVQLKELMKLEVLPNLRDFTASDIHFGRCPVCQDSGYREFLLCNLRQLAIIDGIEVSPDAVAQSIEEQENQIRLFNDELRDIENEFRREMQILERQQQVKETHLSHLEKEMQTSLLELNSLVKEGRQVMQDQLRTQECLLDKNFAVLKERIDATTVTMKQQLDKEEQSLSTLFRAHSFILSTLEAGYSCEYQVSSALQSASHAYQVHRVNDPLSSSARLLSQLNPPPLVSPKVSPMKQSNSSSTSAPIYPSDNNYANKSSLCRAFHNISHKSLDFQVLEDLFFAKPSILDLELLYVYRILWESMDGGGSSSYYRFNNSVGGSRDVEMEDMLAERSRKKMIISNHSEKNPSRIGPDPQSNSLSILSNGESTGAGSGSGSGGPTDRLFCLMTLSEFQEFLRGKWKGPVSLWDQQHSTRDEGMVDEESSIAGLGALGGEKDWGTKNDGAPPVYRKVILCSHLPALLQIHHHLGDRYCFDRLLSLEDDQPSSSSSSAKSAHDSDSGTSAGQRFYLVVCFQVDSSFLQTMCASKCIPAHANKKPFLSPSGEVLGDPFKVWTGLQSTNQPMRLHFENNSLTCYSLSALLMKELISKGHCRPELVSIVLQNPVIDPQLVSSLKSPRSSSVKSWSFREMESIVETISIPSFVEEKSSIVISEYEKNLRGEVQYYLEKLWYDLQESEAHLLKQANDQIQIKETVLRRIRDDIDKERKLQESILREMKFQSNGLESQLQSNGLGGSQMPVLNSSDGGGSSSGSHSNNNNNNNNNNNYNTSSSGNSGNNNGGGNSSGSSSSVNSTSSTSMPPNNARMMSNGYSSNGSVYNSNNVNGGVKIRKANQSSSRISSSGSNSARR